MSYEMSSVAKLKKKPPKSDPAAGTGELSSSKENSREVKTPTTNHNIGTSVSKEECASDY
jgi:hypothetical protein